MGRDVSTYLSIATLLYVPLFLFCVELYSKRKEPLSKSSFIGILIFLLVLWVPLSYCFFYGACVETNYDYKDYRAVNDYIHTLNDKKKISFRNALLSQKANIEKKYGFEWNDDKQKSIEKIMERNPENANPMKVEEYFNDDEYYIKDHWYALPTIIYLIVAYKTSRRLKIRKEHFLGEINRKNSRF